VDPQSEHNLLPVLRRSYRLVSTDSFAWKFAAHPLQRHARLRTKCDQTAARRVRSLATLVLGVCVLVTTCLAAPGVLSRELPQTNSDSQVAKAVAQLQLGSPVEEALRGAESHAYQLQLEANQYLRVMVEQKGVDVAMTLFGPGEAKLAEIILPHTLQGRSQPVWLRRGRIASLRHRRPF